MRKRPNEVRPFNTTQDRQKGWRMDNLPMDYPKDRTGAPMARVTVDNVWATPTTLHMRVTVWGRDYRYRNKYNCAVPVSEIPSEAIDALWAANVDEKYDVDGLQETLF